MTAVVTAASGYDLGYVWHNQAGKDGSKVTEGERAQGRLATTMQKGEPAGRWFGKGAEALGFAQGQEVEREPYDKAYQQSTPADGRAARPEGVGQGQVRPAAERDEGR